MRKFIITGSIQFFLAGLLATAIFIYSCERKNYTINKSEILALPSHIAKDFETQYYDTGRIQLTLSSPLMEQYTNTDPPYSEFKKGITVVFYDRNNDTIALASAKYARYTEKENLWELRDSVVVLNGSNDKLETEQLFWNREKDIIYTDRFVKFISVDQTIMGSGFESDIRLTKRRIRKVHGPIYISEE